MFDDFDNFNSGEGDVRLPIAHNPTSIMSARINKAQLEISDLQKQVVRVKEDVGVAILQNNNATAEKMEHMKRHYDKAIRQVVQRQEKDNTQDEKLGLLDAQFHKLKESIPVIQEKLQ